MAVPFPFPTISLTIVDYGSASGHLSPAFVGANSTVAFLLQACRGDVLRPSVDRDQLNVKRDLGATTNTAWSTCVSKSNSVHNNRFK
jgi:hypothetical protein